MRTKLIELFETLDESVPKSAMKSSSYIRSNSDMSEECRSLYKHMSKMGSLVVKPNSKGVEVIQDTDIRVHSSIAFGHYLDSRYGKLVVPIPVSFL